MRLHAQLLSSLFVHSWQVCITFSLDSSARASSVHFWKYIIVTLDSSIRNHATPQQHGLVLATPSKEEVLPHHCQIAQRGEQDSLPNWGKHESRYYTSSWAWEAFCPSEGRWFCFNVIMLFEVCTCMCLHDFAKALSCLFVQGRGSAQKERVCQELRNTQRLKSWEYRRRHKRMEEADGEAKQKGGDLKEVYKTRSEVLQPLTLFV